MPHQTHCQFLQASSVSLNLDRLPISQSCHEDQLTQSYFYPTSSTHLKRSVVTNFQHFTKTLTCIFSVKRNLVFLSRSLSLRTQSIFAKILHWQRGKPFPSKANSTNTSVSRIKVIKIVCQSIPVFPFSLYLLQSVTETFWIIHFTEIFQ